MPVRCSTGLPALLRGLCLVLATVLQACGGGGGGAEDSPPLAASLVPAAPALGAVLAAQASQLRPSREGATWSYRGSHAAYAGAPPQTYTTATTQSSVGPAGFTESQSNASNEGPDSQAASLADGQVSFTDAIDFAGKGTPERLTIVELRSPVRQGDQWTMLEKRYTDTDLDVDGDGKADAIDVAIFGRVQGMETVVLPDLPAQQAVRVSIHVRARVTASRGNVVGPVVESTLQTWYAPGIGIVRMSSAFPAENGVGDETMDEVLTYWDGVEQGLGVLPYENLVAPASSSVLAGQELTGTIVQTHTFPGHTLMLYQGNWDPTQLAALLDDRGRVTDVKALAGLVKYSGWRLAQLNDEVVMIDEGPGSGATSRRLTRIGADGTLRAPLNSITLELAGDRLVPSLGFSVAVAGDGDRFWLLYDRNYRDTDIFFSIRSERVLRAYNAAGQPVTAERILPMEAGTTFPTLHAQQGRLLFTWRVPQPGQSWHHATLDTATDTWVPGVLAPSLPGDSVYAYPVFLQDGAAVLWSTALGTGGLIPYTSGLRLSTGFEPVRSSNDVNAEQLPGIPTFDMNRNVAQAVGNRLVLASRASGWTGPYAEETAGKARVSWLDTSPATALALTPIHSLRFTMSDPVALSLRADRALVFNNIDGSQIGVSLAWLNAGSR